MEDPLSGCFILITRTSRSIAFDITQAFEEKNNGHSTVRAGPSFT